MVDTKKALIASGLSALAVEGIFWLTQYLTPNKLIIGAAIFSATFIIGFCGMIIGE